MMYSHVFSVESIMLIAGLALFAVCFLLGTALEWMIKRKDDNDHGV